MTAAAGFHIEDETGEAMVGLVVPGTHTNGVPTLYVLDTISPDDSAIRQFHTFQQGDDRQDELIWWLQENWQQTRVQHQQKKWDVPLRYLGDWHKQPGFMIQPSSGDLYTALNWIDDPENKMDFLLAPIVTLGHPHTIGSSERERQFPDGAAAGRHGAARRFLVHRRHGAHVHADHADALSERAAADAGRIPLASGQ